MSETVDKKIVELEFDNAQFKTGIAETLQAIKTLDSSLELKKGVDGLSNVSVAASKVDFGDIIKGTDEVGGRLSGLKSIAETAFSGIQSIAGTFMKGAGIASLITSIPLVAQSISGGLSRAQKISQAKFTMEGLGVEWKEIFQDINNSVDGTAYGLDQAATAASSLVASGVETGEQMETVLKSIAGLAAMTGADYDGIANIMTTVAGQGKLMTMQLRQLESRGFNAAASLAEYMKQFEGFEQITEADVRELVSNGEISFELFSAAMSQYADQAAKANNTFSGAMSNIKAALSRTTADFFEEVMGSNGLVPVLNDIRLTINALNNATSSLMHNEIDNETREITKYGVVIKGVLDILKEVDRAFKDILQLDENGKVQGSYFARWKETLDTIAPVVEGFFNFVKQDVYNLTMLAFNMGAIFREITRLVFTFITPIAEALDEVFGTSFHNFTGMLAEGSANIAEALYNIRPTEDVLNAVKEAFVGVFTVAKTLAGVVGGVLYAGFQLLLKVGEGVVSVVTFLAGRFNDLIELASQAGGVVGDFFSGLFSNISESDAFKAVHEFLKPFFDFVDSIAQETSVGGVLTQFFGMISDSISSFDINGVFGAIQSGASDFVSFMSPIGEAIVNFFTGIFGGVSSFFGAIDLPGILSPAMDALSGFGDYLASILGIKEAFADTGDAASGSVSSLEVFAGKLRDIAEIGRDKLISTFGDAFSFIGEKATQVWNFVFPIIEEVGKTLSGIWTGIVEAFEKSELSIEPVVKLFGELKDAVSEFFKNVSEDGFSFGDLLKLFGSVKDSVGSMIAEIGPNFSAFMSDVGTSIGEQLDGPVGEFYDMLMSIGDVLLNLPDKISKIPESIGGALSSLSGLIKNPFAPEKAYADDGLSSGVEELSNTGFDLVEALEKLVKLLSHPLETMRTFFTDTFSAATTAVGAAIDNGIAAINVDNIKNFIIEVASIGGLVGSLWSIYELDSLMHAARGFIDGMSGVLESLKKGLDSVAKSLDTLTKTVKENARANNFLKYVIGFAASIAILAGSLYLISTIDESRLWGSVGAIAALAGVMLALVLVMEFINGPKMEKLFSDKGGEGAVKSILALSAAVLVLAESVKMLGNMDSGALQQGLQSMLLMLVMLGVMASMVSAVSGITGGGGASTILSMAVALGVLTVAVQVLASVPWLVVIDGLFKAGAMMVVFAGAVKLLNAASKDMVSLMPTLIGMAVGIMAFAGALALLKVVVGGDYLTLFADLAALAGGILALGLAMKIMSAFEGDMLKAGAGIAIMSAALISLSVALAILNIGTGGDIIKMAGELLVLVLALAGMAAILALLGGAAPATTAAAMSLLIMSGAIAVFAGMAVLLGLIPFQVIVQGLLALLGVIVAFGATAAILAGFSWAIAAFGVSLSTLGLAIALIVGSFLAFSYALTLLASLAPEAFANIGDGIVAFADRIAAGGDNIVRAAEVIGESLAATVSSFFSRLISDVANGISGVASAVEGKEGEIFNGAMVLGKALIAGILGGLVGIGQAILGAIVDGIGGVFNQSSQIMAETGAAMSAEMADYMAKNPEQFVDVGKTNIGKVEEGMQVSDEGKQAGAQIATNMADGVGEGLAPAMEGVDASQALAEPIDNADPAAAASALQSFYGDAFSSEDLMAGFGDLGSGIPEQLMAGIFDGAKNINVDPSSLLNTMGLTSGAFDQNAGDVGKSVGKAFTDGTNESLSDGSSLMTGVQNQVNVLQAHESEYRNAGVQSGIAYTNALTESMSTGEIEAAIVNSQASMESGVDVASDAGARAGQAYGSAQVEALSAVGTLISSTIMMNFQSATEGSGAEESGNTAGVLYDGGAIEGLLSGVGELISTAASNFQRAATESDPGGKGYDAGRWFAEGASSGVSDNIGDMSGTVGSAFSDAASDSDPGGKGYNAGRWFAEGMASGIREYASSVAEEAARMVSDAKAAADAAADSHSPSREMMKRGMWFDQGMAKGIREYSSLVTEAASGMAEGAMDKASSSMSLMGGLVDDMDWDADPVISPVLDLEDFEAGASRMNDLMPTSQVVAAAYADRVWSGGASDQVAQNGSSTTIYLTLDWKAGTTANQMASQLARELETWNLTKGK